jgi:CXXX repeat radical SAM target protein
MKKSNDEELQSRRQFFKNVAKGTLPILGAIALANMPLIANAAQSESGYCPCYGNCVGNCTGSCNTACLYGCKTHCSGACVTTCTYR